MDTKEKEKFKDGIHEGHNEQSGHLLSQVVKRNFRENYKYIKCKVQIKITLFYQ